MAICESCGRDEAATTKVQRIYLLPAEGLEGASPAEIEQAVTPTAGDIERWCGSCCATFPHVVLDPGADD